MNKTTYDQLASFCKYRKPTNNSRNVPDKLVQIVNRIVKHDTGIEWGEIVCVYQYGISADKTELWCEFVYKIYNSARTHKVYSMYFNLKDVQDDYEVTDDERYDYVVEMWNLTDEERVL